MTAGLVLVSVIIVVLVFGGRSPSKTEEIPFIQAPSAQAPASINKKGSGPTVGIPLSNIPEQRQRYEEVVSENFPSVSVDEIPPPPVRGIFESAQEPELREINEIRDLIQAATAEAKQPEPYIYPGELVSRGISIPNLRVKGIIFFSSGSPSNHIFVSTLESKNRKVRVGDIIQSATLKHIESNRVVFSYRGETVHLRIGE